MKNAVKTVKIQATGQGKNRHELARGTSRIDTNACSCELKMRISLGLHKRTEMRGKKRETGGK